MPVNQQSLRPTQIKLLAAWLCMLLAIYTALRPTFNFYSYGAARISDFSAIAAFAFITLIGASLAGRFPVKTLTIRLSWAAAFACTILISLIGEGLVAKYSPADFADLARPMLIFLALSAGYFTTYSFYTLKSVDKLLIWLAVLALAMGLAQSIFPGQTTIFWKIYSVKNALLGFSTGRPTAYFYHFTELANFLILAGLIAIITAQKLRFTPKIGLAVIGIIFILGSTVSTSRVGLVFLALAGAYYVLEDLALHFTAKRIATYLVIIAVALVGGIAFVVSSPKYSSIFLAAIDLTQHTTLKSLSHFPNASIANRVKQILLFLDAWRHHDYRMIIGSGPLRSDKQFYFELEWVKLLFRYGVLGTLTYYTFFVGSFITKVPEALTGHIRVIRALCFAYILSDAFSGVSEIIKGISLFIFWYGAVLGERDKIAAAASAPGECKDGPLAAASS